LVGVLKGIQADLPTLSVLLLGVITATGGGMIRDILLTRTPSALLPGAPYALLALVGGIMAVILDATGTNKEWLWWMPVATVVLLRFIALYFGWQTPIATDLPAQVGAMVPEGAIPQPLRGMRPSRFVPPMPHFGERDADDSGSRRWSLPYFGRRNRGEKGESQ
jgi:hypothetical protein